MTDNELKALVASLAVAQKETSKQQKETDKQIQATAKQLEETNQDIHARQKESQHPSNTDLALSNSKKEIDMMIQALDKQIKNLSGKFSGFTDGLALPSMEKVLQQQFKMEVISPSVRVHKVGADIEIDVLAYANSPVNEIYVVEVKSHVREDSIIQLQNIIKNFDRFFPEHQDKKLFGILAAVDMPVALRKRILDLGFYAAKIKDEIFSLDIPAGFKPKAF